MDRRFKPAPSPTPVLDDPALDARMRAIAVEVARKALERERSGG